MKDDLISKQTVLTMLDDIEDEVMDGEGYQYGKWSEYVEQLPAAQPDLSSFCDKLWRNAYEIGKAEAQRWIPCSERLPDEAGTYMVTDYAGGISEVATDEYFCRDDGKPVWMYSQNVVAWMPLPKPWKEGQDGNS